MKPKTRDLQIARQIKQELQSKLGDQLVSVFLYGSRAKGTATLDSDLDILLLLKRKPHAKHKVEDLVIETTYPYLNSDNVYVSAIPYPIDSYKKWREYSPVLHWIDREGIKV